MKTKFVCLWLSKQGVAPTFINPHKKNHKTHLLKEFKLSE